MSWHSNQLSYALGIGGMVSLYGIMSLGIYYLGPMLGLGTVSVIVIIALLLLTWPIAILFMYFRRKRAARREAEAAASGDEAPQAKAAQKSKGAAAAAASNARVSEDVTRDAEEAVQWLKSSRLGDANAKDAVYGLPWYLVAGPPASGKTSLLLASGLSFQTLPSQRSAEQNIVRPTQHCEWRVTDSAVLLDTAGRYQTEGPQRDEWAGLIETIKKHRRDRPLDGMLVIADAERILRSSEAEIEQQAKVMRARLDDLMQRARARFPVYLVFTHADVIEGFREFFTSKSGDGRSQVWGTTIPLNKSQNAHALFDVEFDLLYDSLMKKRLRRLGIQGAPAEQLRVFNFPHNFAEARSRLGLFTSFLFRPNPFSESPLLRGFYFTANVAGARREAVAVEADGDGDERGAHAVGRGYFTEKFFREVILQDKDLAASFQAFERRPPKLRNILLIAGAVLLTLFLALSLVSFLGNRKLIAEATERGARVDEITKADFGHDPLKKEPAAARVEVEAVDALREELVKLDSTPPIYLRFGMYSGNDIAPYLHTIYFDSIEQRFKKPTVAALERDLRNFAAGTPSATVPNPSAAATNVSASGQTASQEDILGRHYDLLKAYLMLSDASRVEPTFLASTLEDYWKKSSPPDMEIVSLQQLDFFSRQLTREDAPHIKVDDQLVSQVRRKLQAYPPINRFYKRITTEINAKASPVSIDSILQGTGRGVLLGTYTVPGSYTVDGYRNYMKAAIETAAQEISKEDWVMGAAASNAQTQATDISKLQSMYFRDYTDQWRKFLTSTSVQQFKSRDDAIEALKVLSSTDSPMERVMMEVARNTNLSAKPEAKGWWAWIKSWFTSSSSTDTGGNTEVEKEFAPLFRFVASDSKQTSSPMSQYRAELRRVLEQLQNTTQDQLTQTSKALLTGQDNIGLQKAEQSVGALLEAFKTAAAADAAGLLNQPLGNLRAMLYGGGIADIERAWREQIYPVAHRLESGYPFTGAGESSVTDLARFLNPTNGQFTTFFNSSLATSFDDVDGQWRLKPQGVFKFSDEFVAYLNSARRLREALFPTNGAQPEVSYEVTLQPVQDMDVVINIDGTPVETRGTSAQSSKFIWPARSGASGATITVTPGNGQQIPPKTFPGEWGLFKMIDAGGGASGAGQFNLSWNVGGVPVRATLRPSSANNPFQRSLFTNMHAPQNVRR